MLSMLSMTLFEEGIWPIIGQSTMGFFLVGLLARQAKIMLAYYK